MSGSIGSVATGGSSVLTVSSNPADAVTVRAFASGVGRALDLEEESIEDLKLLLTEICAQSAGSDAGTALTVEIEGGAVVAVTCTGAGPPPRNAEGAQHREQLIRALAPELRWAEDGTVEFSLLS